MRPHKNCDSEIAAIVSALSSGGVFNRNAVLIGTAAYNQYAAVFERRLPPELCETNNVDIAQCTLLTKTSIEPRVPVLEVLQRADPSFRPIPSLYRSGTVTSYLAANDIRVEFLVCNTGPDREKPIRLNGLSTHGYPVRFLDFIVCNEERILLLNGLETCVRVPKPEYFAIHKLLVARRRQSEAKRGRDMMQSQSLLTLLIESGQDERLSIAWGQAIARGPAWRRLLLESVGKLDSSIRHALRDRVEL